MNNVRRQSGRETKRQREKDWVRERKGTVGRAMGWRGQSGAMMNDRCQIEWRNQNQSKYFLKFFSWFFFFVFGFLRTRPVPHLAATAAFAASFADWYWWPLCAGSAAAPQRTPRPLLVILMRHSTRSSWQRCCCHCWLRWCCRQRREQRCQRLQCAKCCCKCRL